MTQMPMESGVPSYEQHAGTSVLAIVSLIAGVLALLTGCFVIGGLVFGPLALLLGLVALVAKGAKGGTGLAIGGVVTGLIGIALSAVVVFGFGSMMTQMSGYADTISAAQAGKTADVRTRLSTAASNELTDEEIVDWGLDVAAEFGNSQGAPDNILGHVQGWMQFGSRPNTTAWMNGQQNLYPLPMIFDNGETMTLVRMNTQSSAQGLPEINDIGVVRLADDGILWLVDGLELFDASPGSGSEGGAPSGTGEGGEEPASGSEGATAPGGAG